MVLQVAQTLLELNMESFENMTAGDHPNAELAAAIKKVEATALQLPYTISVR